MRNFKYLRITDDPYWNETEEEQKLWSARGLWPCRWISRNEERTSHPTVVEYSLSFSLKKDETIRFHFSADQECRLFIDEKLAGEYSASGDASNWYYQTVEVSISRGLHNIKALVWNWSEMYAMAKLTVHEGFLFSPQTPRFQKMMGTGIARWKCRLLQCHKFTKHVIRPHAWTSVPPSQITDFIQMESDTPLTVPVCLEHGMNGFVRYESGLHLLKAEISPLSLKERVTSAKLRFVSDNVGQDVLEGNGLVDAEDNQLLEETGLDTFFSSGRGIIPPFSKKRLIIDFDDYVCAFLALYFSGGYGAKVRLTWAEALWPDKELVKKCNRNLINGQYFRGIWDSFIANGKPGVFRPFSWRCGRFVEVLVETDKEEFCIEKLEFEKTSEDLDFCSVFSCENMDINAIVPACIKTLSCSMHENVSDCPFYERVSYSGDGRVESLVSLVSCTNNDLNKKLILLLDSSREADGIIKAAWPSRVKQRIPSFSLAWIGMVYDWALWRGEPEFIKKILPGVRTTLDLFDSWKDSQGFVVQKEKGWWYFVDWVAEWDDNGNYVPPALNGVNATFNWLYVYSLRLAAELENYIGDKRYSEIYYAKAKELSSLLYERFFDKTRALFKEDDSGNNFSEHAQIIAILSDTLGKQKNTMLFNKLEKEKDISKASVYFQHYLFDAAFKLNRPDFFLNKLEQWNEWLRLGLKTFPEGKPHVERSDCHGWGAHPLYHLISGIAGIKPAKMGFDSVSISPQLGKLKTINAECVHPKGIIKTHFVQKENKFFADISIPDGLTGTWKIGTDTGKLSPGRQQFVTSLK